MALRKAKIEASHRVKRVDECIRRASQDAQRSEAAHKLAKCARRESLRLKTIAKVKAKTAESLVPPARRSLNSLGSSLEELLRTNPNRTNRTETRNPNRGSLYFMKVEVENAKKRLVPSNRFLIGHQTDVERA